MAQYLRFSDPGHSWLEVPLRDVRDAGVLGGVSAYSYIDRARKLVYLEEDCDAPLFMGAIGLTAEDVRTVTFCEDCRVRRLPPFDPARDGA